MGGQRWGEGIWGLGTWAEIRHLPPARGLQPTLHPSTRLSFLLWNVSCSLPCPGLCIGASSASVHLRVTRTPLSQLCHAADEVRSLFNALLEPGAPLEPWVQLEPIGVVTDPHSTGLPARLGPSAWHRAGDGPHRRDSGDMEFPGGVWPRPGERGIPEPTSAWNTEGVCDAADQPGGPGKGSDWPPPSSFLTRSLEGIGPKPVGEPLPFPGSQDLPGAGQWLRLCGYAGGRHHGHLYTAGWPAEQTLIFILTWVTHDDFIF